jgi:predicted DNA-binding protein (MmcQ/YjbR family)
MTNPKTRKKPTRRPAPRPSGLRKLARELRNYAMGFPGATEDFPWGERVAKVNGKVFVFLGCDPTANAEMGLSVKLPVSSEEALELPFTKPTGYGLGKAGWVSANFGPKDAPPVPILKSWIHESYRSIAPKKLLDELESSRLEPLSRRSRSERRGGEATPPSKPPADPTAPLAAPGSGSRRPR